MPKRNASQKTVSDDANVPKPDETSREADEKQGGLGEWRKRGRETVDKLKAISERTMGEWRGDAATDRAWQAKGGWLEFLGGSFGTGRASISVLGPDRHLGFVAQGECVDLESEIDSIEAAADSGEHRLVSAAGWAWFAGTLLGPAGIAVGGGVRLLHPRKMVINARLRDGRMIVARTDSVTAAALLDIAAANAGHETNRTV